MTYRPEPPPRKNNAECCRAKIDSDGRLPIGFCGPNCLRRPEVWRRVS